MKYNEPFTMNDEQLKLFKAGKKVFSKGKCDIVKDKESPFKLTYFAGDHTHTVDMWEIT